MTTHSAWPLVRMGRDNTEFAVDSLSRNPDGCVLLTGSLVNPLKPVGGARYQCTVAGGVQEVRVDYNRMLLIEEGDNLPDEPRTWPLTRL